MLTGENFPTELSNSIKANVSKSCRVWNIYGPAETTIDCTFHVVDSNSETDNIPIGLPVPNYQCLIKDHFLQNVTVNQEGELFVGGVGVFAGYLGRDDLTEKVFIEIDGEIFYRTGDLVRMENNGFLHYIGRKDHQIKLHGQRIELGEIERCLLKIVSISGCVVTKWGDDHLVAYVQSSTVDENQLRAHCQLRLPPHMVPSFFMILEKLPLNVNGKIDRKNLPSPNFVILSHAVNEDQYGKLDDALENQLRSIWSETLERTDISSNANFFSLGGHSLLLIRLYHRYKTMFQIDTDGINIQRFMENPTIIDHARLILSLIPSTKQTKVSWCLLTPNSGNCF